MFTRGNHRRTRRVSASLESTSIAWPATLAQKREHALRREHLRFTPRASHHGVLHCFLLDCSASMLGGEQLALAKGLLVACFDRAAAERDEVALVTFGGERADVRFGPAVPRWWNDRWLRPLGGGGGTPLASGIEAATRLLDRAARRAPSQHRVLWLLTDGRSRAWPARPQTADRIVVVDCERVTPALERCVALAKAWGADYTRADAMAG